MSHQRLPTVSAGEKGLVYGIIAQSNQAMASVKLFNPSERKTDARSCRCSFIGYPERAKGYRFYCSGRGGKIVESLNARFLELDVTDVSNNVEPIYQNDSTHQNDSIAISMPASEEIVVPSSIITTDVQEVVPQEYHDPPLIADQGNPVLIRRSERQRRRAIPSDYVGNDFSCSCDLSLFGDKSVD
ncbi:Retrovirus-related Pol polyprotein from transposon TNT 1-94 [Senna tora]|uniref:Retrovirus-related Pol polyprotein from transposon TNT 1-94 n=1 Tax=Senna tora TaxID=362788 RepID=A0A835CE16_9FABA|nr:Retrovirus-related Pol polyprotein from transposon TNT 1-94 [Senna tora]